MPAAMPVSVRPRRADAKAPPKRALSSPGGSARPSEVRARPFLKWAGGKQQLLPAFASLYPAADKSAGYHEPFLGSGAVFFDVRSRFARRRCTLSDGNAELIATFTAVRDDVEGVIGALLKHRAQHGPEHFYAVRAIEPDQVAHMSVVERGARFIYLNKTCFNGLHRVNSRGHFNVPMGRYTNPAIVDPEVLRAASAALRGVRLSAGPFSSVLTRARRGDVVYFDPPYVPLTSTAYFTSYTAGAFGEAEQRALAAVYRKLHDRGCRVMLSNSDTPLVHELYADFDRHRVMARRNINSKGDRRGHVAELVVCNYPVSV
ncbi:MAG TPA: DNA adenine methylase [Polyangia bacterium]